MSAPAWSHGPTDKDPWWGRYTFYVTSSWGPWVRCVLGACVVVLLVAIVAGAVTAGVVLAVEHAAPAAAGGWDPTTAGVVVGGGSATMATVMGVIKLVRRRREGQLREELNHARGC